MEAKLCFFGHGLMEKPLGADHRHPPNARLRPCRAAGRAGYAADFVEEWRKLNVRPMWLRTPADGARPPTGAPPSTPGYAASQRIRQRIEEPFGWIKSVAGMQIGRASCRERVCQFGRITWVAGS